MADTGEIWRQVGYDNALRELQALVKADQGGAWPDGFLEPWEMLPEDAARRAEWDQNPPRISPYFAAGMLKIASRLGEFGKTCAIAANEFGHFEPVRRLRIAMAFRDIEPFVELVTVLPGAEVAFAMFGHHFRIADSGAIVAMPKPGEMPGEIWLDENGAPLDLPHALHELIKRHPRGAHYLRCLMPGRETQAERDDLIERTATRLADGQWWSPASASAAPKAPPLL